MKQRFRKFLAAFVTMSMVCAMTPMSAFAESVDEETVEPIVEVVVNVEQPVDDAVADAVEPEAQPVEPEAAEVVTDQAETEVSEAAPEADQTATEDNEASDAEEADQATSEDEALAAASDDEQLMVYADEDGEVEAVFLEGITSGHNVIVNGQPVTVYCMQGAKPWPKNEVPFVDVSNGDVTYNNQTFKQLVDDPAIYNQLRKALFAGYPNDSKGIRDIIYSYQAPMLREWGFSEEEINEQIDSTFEEATQDAIWTIMRDDGISGNDNKHGNSDDPKWQSGEYDLDEAIMDYSFYGSMIFQYAMDDSVLANPEGGKLALENLEASELTQQNDGIWRTQDISIMDDNADYNFKGHFTLVAPESVTVRLEDGTLVEGTPNEDGTVSHQMNGNKKFHFEVADPSDLGEDGANISINCTVGYASELHQYAPTEPNRNNYTGATTEYQTMIGAIEHAVDYFKDLFLKATGLVDPDNPDDDGDDDGDESDDPDDEGDPDDGDEGDDPDDGDESDDPDDEGDEPGDSDDDPDDEGDDTGDIDDVDDPDDEGGYGDDDESDDGDDSSDDDPNNPGAGDEEDPDGSGDDEIISDFEEDPDGLEGEAEDSGIITINPLPSPAPNNGEVSSDTVTEKGITASNDTQSVNAGENDKAAAGNASDSPVTGDELAMLPLMSIIAAAVLAMAAALSRKNRARR